MDKLEKPTLRAVNDATQFVSGSLKVGTDEVPAPPVEHASLEALAQETEDLMTSMQSKHVRFAIAVSAGERHGKAYTMAGYRNKNPMTAGANLCRRKDIRRLVTLLRRRYAMENGIGLAWKRQRIIDAINLAEEIKQPGSMISGVRLLAELDSDLETVTTTGGTLIQVITGVSRGELEQVGNGVTIENE